MVSDTGTRPPAAAAPRSIGRRRLIRGMVGGAGLAVVAIAGIWAWGREGLSPEDSMEAAVRQLDLLAVGGPDALRAAEDTATIIAGMADAPVAARAVAGHVLGKLSATRGDTAAAVRHLEGALDLDPSLEEARTLLSRLRREGLDPAQASASLARQLDRLTDPTLADLRAAADTAAMITGMEEVPSSTRALAHHVLGRVSIAQGDTAGAEAWLERALELDADRDDSAALLAALRQRGRTDPDPTPPVRAFGPAEAEDVVFRQLDRLVDPTPARLRAAGDTAAMVVDMDGAPASVRAVAAYVLAEVSVARQDTAQAIRWLDRALAFDPGQQGPRTLLERLQGG
jgi:tetratricopeptide (TPR) repeat protein